ncbi:MAG TPA: hypothetical protein VIG62_05360 [Blastocatellia bacterium]|jgi:hypothetical protein
MRTTWTVKGRIRLRHGQSIISDSTAHGDVVNLPLVQVRVSARQKVLGVWSPWNSWGATKADIYGSFSITNEKDRDQRLFMVEVMFKNDKLKIYPENDGLMNYLLEKLTSLVPGGDIVEDVSEQILEQTSRLAFDVKWILVLQEDKNSASPHSAGTVDLGDIVFDLNSFSIFLANDVAVKHAITWFVYTEAIDLLKEAGAGFRDDRKPIALKYPHNNKLIKDYVESSYCDPANKVIFIIKNTQVDQFDIDAILHELMHVWAYQHSKGEMGLAWQLAVHGSTHTGRQEKTFVAFHEAFAEWASNRLTEKLFQATSQVYGTYDDLGIPFTRAHLQSIGITSLSELDHYEEGWMSIFNMLFAKRLHRFDLNGADRYPADIFPPPLKKQCDPPFLDIQHILRVFNPQPQRGYKDYLRKEEMNLDSFLKRACDVLFPQNSQQMQDNYRRLLDPNETVQPQDLFCI